MILAVKWGQIGFRALHCVQVARRLKLAGGVHSAAWTGRAAALDTCCLRAKNVWKRRLVRSPQIRHTVHVPSQCRGR